MYEPQRHLTRRGFLTATAMSAAAAGLAPLATHAATTRKKPATLNLLNANWGQLYDQDMERIGNSYVKQHPGTKINWNFVNSSDWQTKLVTEIAAGTPPDATYTSWAAQAQLASSGDFEPLDSHLKSAGLKASSFLTGPYNTCVWDGKVYAVPGGSDWLVYFVNKDVYRAAGLDPKKPPTTTDELIRHSKEIVKKDSGGNITRIGYVPAASDFMYWAYIFGGSFYDPEKNQITANNPANIDALQWMLDYVKVLDVNKLDSFSQLPGEAKPGDPFYNNQKAYEFTGFWNYQPLDQYAPHVDYSVTFLPTLHGKPEERANYVIQGWEYGIPKGVKNPEAAWEFIKFAFVDKAALMGAETLNGPCVLDALPSFITQVTKMIGKKNRLTPYLNIFTETAKAGTKTWPVIPVNSYYYTQITNVFDSVMHGKQTPKEALDQVTQQVTAQMKGSS